MIRKAVQADIPDIMEIVRACALDMISKGIFQWNEQYPNPEAFLLDIDRGELFALQTGDRLIGCMAVSGIKDDEYDQIKWLTPDTKNMYIHRLAVHPSFQGRGYARKMMDFAEDLARKNKASSVRLDTFSKNKRNQRFYESRGYIKLADIFFPNQSEFPFHCYELVL